MKILLLGEYSRLHNTLKEALISLGHEVVLVSDGDLFKKYPSDIDISSRLRNFSLTSLFSKVVYRFFNKDLFSIEKTYRIKKIYKNFKDFDIVQLINQDPFNINVDIEKEILKFIFDNNNKFFVLACGDDTHVIEYYDEKKMKYSVLTPVHLSKISKKNMYFSYKYLDDKYRELYNFVMKNVAGVIPTDLDYNIPYGNHPKSVGMIPNPVNLDKIKNKDLIIDNKINIFFGINDSSYYKKGADIIERVLRNIEDKYSEVVNVEIVRNLPYSEYIIKYEEAHIFIDQLYSYDQGYNALEAMAKGKCVITGAEREFYEFYKLDKEVAINGIPDENVLYSVIEDLIFDKDRIIKTGRNAAKFIKEYHHYINIAKKYLDIWDES